ncbi:MAG: leucyl aminopeptidase [Thioalkalispiraceae bacterium]|jgi:leucyl aminopeptidase
MNISVKTLDITKHKTGCHVVALFEGAKLSETATKIDKLANGYLKAVVKQGGINGKLSQTLLLHDVKGLTSKRVLLVGCGKNKSLSDSQYRSLLKTVANTLNSYNINDASIYLQDLELKSPEIENTWKVKQISEVLTQSLYRYTRTLSKKNDKPSLRKLVIHVDKVDTSLSRAARTGQAVANGMAVTRELGDLPGNICTPTHLGNEAKKIGRQYGIKVSVLGQKQIEALKMGSFLSVAKGSREAPKLIVFEYKGAAKPGNPIALVGKGITFDSGGISIKPGAAMDEMKFDMCGAASVLGVMRSLGELKPKVNVVGVIASCENLPDGKANKPGDVVTSMSGQTIEILNTDAEGRLILCDALTYTEKFKPRAVIDIATLTGACVIALGHYAAGLLGNDQKLIDKLVAAGQNAADRAWQLPMWDEYQDSLKSNFADMANIGGRSAGTITAACFLSRFAKKFKWAHLDIAGIAWDTGANKGATGRPVPLLMEYILSEAGRK